MPGLEIFVILMTLFLILMFRKEAEFKLGLSSLNVIAPAGARIGLLIVLFSTRKFSWMELWLFAHEPMLAVQQAPVEVLPRMIAPLV